MILTFQKAARRQGLPSSKAFNKIQLVLCLLLTSAPQTKKAGLRTAIGATVSAIADGLTVTGRRWTLPAAATIPASAPSIRSTKGAERIAIPQAGRFRSW